MEEKVVLQFDLLGTFACRRTEAGQTTGSVISDKLGKRPCPFYSI